MPNIPQFMSWNKTPLRPHPPRCPICNESVVLETSKTDENGKAIHEECYVFKIGLKPTTKPLDS